MAIKVGELYSTLTVDKGPFEKALKLAKIAVLAVVGAIAGIGVAAGKAAVEFEKGMANVQTLIGSGSESDKRIKELGGALKTMSVETGKSLGDLSAGLYQVISAFGDSGDAVGLLEVAAKASTAGLSTTLDAVNLLSAVTKGYGDTTKEAAEHTSDLAFKTVVLGQTTFPELAASMGAIIPIAAAMKVKQEELFAATATLTGVTGNTSEVMTQLKSIMVGVLKPNKNMTAALEDLGYTGANAASELIGDKGLVGAVRALVGTSTAAEVGLGKMFRNAEGLPAIFALTGAQAEIFNEKLAAMADVAGETDEAFKIQEATVEATMHRVQAAINVVLVTLGEKFLPVLADMLDWVLAHMPQIQAVVEGVFAGIASAIDWVTKNVIPPLVAVFKFVAEQVVPAISQAFDSVSEKVMPSLAEAFDFIQKTVIPAFGKAFEWIRTNILPPLQRIFKTWSENILPVLILAFATVVKVVKDNWPTIMSIAEKVGSVVKTAFDVIVTVLEVVYPIIRAVAEVLFPALGEAAGILLSIIDQVFGGIGDYIDFAINDVIIPTINTLLGLWNSAPAIFAAVGEGIGAGLAVLGEIVGTVFDGIREAIRLVLSILYDFGYIVATIVTAVIGFFADLLAPEIELIGAIFSTVFGAIKAVVEAVAGAIGAAVGWVVQTIFPGFSSGAQAAGSVIGGVFSTIQSVISGVAGVVGSVLRTLGSVVFGGLGAAANVMKTILSTAFSVVVGAVSTALTLIRPITDAIGGAFRAMGGVISGVWDAITSVIKGAINGVISAVNSLIRALNGIQIHIPGVDTPFGKVGKMDWNGLRLGQIPYLAKGMWEVPGIMPAMLHPKEAVLSAGEAEDYRRRRRSGNGVDVTDGGGGPDIKIIVEGDVYGDGIDQLADKLAWRLRLAGA
jgi:TP901 family phage tail tape measure protein